ncbi:XrtA-associated tyrosine autokinase [Methylomonas rosea]|uniref:non-specific protein-tyrosine kinase n=1 Tax=Methylomonas rosea TaxID=2952227 RepID=A0ABT1TSA2_9GAMM|nr:XrtA-associated tyrosine autokinase [Methylomonas sp. WSC-7]MCQ8117665.1 XrtA-associated tyrosine autokinase [Methylomonas sp. WSC-7]
MSIIENALKKAGSQGLVVENSSQDSAITSKPDRGASESNLESVELRESSHAFSPEQQVVVDWVGLAENGFIDNNNAKSQLAEEFRVIKRPLVNNIQGAENNGINRSNLILICSSLPGEGKTFVSINLALSIANERDKKVLLIDADVEKPSISKQLGINSPRGLIEYLEDDKVTFSDILLKTDLPNLSLITAGKRHKYSTELLSSQRMYLFAEEVSRRYKDRIVIFDSPPLLVATQAQILAELVGQVVLVIAAEVTPQSVVNESVAKLSNCDVVMTLLNKTRKEIDIYGHNYSYGKYGHL